MKVALIANTSWYLFNFRGSLIRRLIKEGNDVYTISPKDEYSEKLEKLGADVLSTNFSQTGKNPIGELKTLLSLRKKIKDIQPDFIFTFTIKCNLYTAIINKYSNYSFSQILNISGVGEGLSNKKTKLFKFLKFLYNFSLCSDSKICFQNSEDLILFKKLNIIKKAMHCSIMHGSGVDLNTYQYIKRSNFKNTHFFMFGRLIKEKGFEVFLNAAIKLNDHQVFKSKAIFTIQGIPDKNRAESIELLRKVRIAHGKGIITYLEPTDNIINSLKKIDVVVLPSWYNEGVPRSLLEGLAMGKPLITTDWKGCRDTIKNGNGILVAPQNVSQLVKAFKTMCNANQETWEEMGLASRELAEKTYDENLIINQYLDFLTCP